MKSIKRTLAVLLSALMLFTATPITAMAETGRLNDTDVYYELTDEGVLRLYGSGATPDYPAEPDASPFAGKYVEKVVVEQGVTRLGNYIFAECGDIEEVSLPKSLLSVGNVAFGGCSSLKEITFNPRTENFGFAAFYGCRSLKSVTFKANRINSYGLYDVDVNSLLYSVEDANIYVTLPLTVEETLNDVSTKINTYEDAVAKFGQNNNTVYCVNDNAKIKWKNYDGTVLETDENAAQGEIPTYDGATPTKPADDNNAYYFTGWTPQPVAVIGDMSYTATYGSYGKSTYIDRNGDEREAFARPLTGTETLLSPGWYVVNKNINYSHTLYFTDEVHIILADGKRLTFSNGCDFSLADPSKCDVDSTYEPTKTRLNFYWQSGKTGTLTMNGQILTWRLNIYGGNITSKVSGYVSTFYDGNLTFKDEAQCSWLNVYGGSVNMESCDAGAQFNVYGGNFRCTGTVSTDASAYVTLGYTKPSDSIYIGYLYLEGNKNNSVNQHVKIKDGQKMADNADRSAIFEGELPISSDLITVPDINGKTLVPYAHNTITYSRCLDGTVTGVDEADYGDEITLTVTPDEGYALDELTVTTSDNKNIEVVDNKFIMPASAVTVSATFISTKRYTVKWMVDGEVVETDENLMFGATPEYNGAVPQKAATEQYSYSFEGWSPAITPVASDVTYTAQFSISLNTYTVRWVVNGETVETDENVYYGMTPEFGSEIASMYFDDDMHYTFAGWNDGDNTYAAGEIPAVSGDVTYVAVYDAHNHIYGEPEWSWSADNSTATATFTCADCGNTHSETVNSAFTDNKGKRTFTVTAEIGGTSYTDTKTVVLPDGFNLTIEDSIHLNLYVNADAYDADTITVTYSNPGTQNGATKTDTYNVSELTPAADGRYAVKVLAAPAQIRDTVTVTAGSHTFTTTVAAYCEALISEGSDAKLAALAKSMLDYGKAASDEFNYNESLFKTQAYYNTDDATSNVSEVGIINSASANGRFAGYSYIAKSVPALRIYLNTTEAEVLANNLKAKVNGSEAKIMVVEGTEEVCVDITGILAEQLNGQYTVEFNGGTLRINALQYAKRIGGNTDFGRSMYNYWLAAKAYFV